jgi:hypothetical protein
VPFVPTSLGLPIHLDRFVGIWHRSNRSGLKIDPSPIPRMPLAIHSDFRFTKIHVYSAKRKDVFLTQIWWNFGVDNTDRAREGSLRASYNAVKLT